MKQKLAGIGRWALALVGIGVVGGGALLAQSKPAAVEAVMPQRKLVIESLSASERRRAGG
jgi:hypothetical protein